MQIQPEYHRICVSSVPNNNQINKIENKESIQSIVQAVALRDKYLFVRSLPEKDDHRLIEFQRLVRHNPFSYHTPPPLLPQSSSSLSDNEVSAVDEEQGHSVHKRIRMTHYSWNSETGLAQVENILSPIAYEEFAVDLWHLYHVICCGKKENTFAHLRLKFLDLNYALHTTLNAAYECRDSRDDSADFNTIMKVDTHIHGAGAMTQKEMLDFIVHKFETEGDVPVLETGDTLKECLLFCGIEDPSKVTTEKLDMAASAKMFHRFEIFNDAYNPFGKTDLRTIFMKTSNAINGRYFAEILRDVVFDRVLKSRSQTALEPRLSIYGFGYQEWSDLANFFITHRVQNERVKWMIQVPRLCNVFMGKKYQSFDELLRNIFEPMFQATLYPEAHPNIHVLLSNIGAVDSVDDESVFDPLLLEPFVKPALYTTQENPPYSYWCYYMANNLQTLNRLRESKGMNTILFKPHCGESGQRHHLATTYLLASSINHGIKLRESPMLEYLYYISQVFMIKLFPTFDLFNTIMT